MKSFTSVLLSTVMLFATNCFAGIEMPKDMAAFKELCDAPNNKCLIEKEDFILMIGNNAFSIEANDDFDPRNGIKKSDYGARFYLSTDLVKDNNLSDEVEVLIISNPVETTDKVEGDLIARDTGENTMAPYVSVGLTEAELNSSSLYILYKGVWCKVNASLSSLSFENYDDAKIFSCDLSKNLCARINEDSLSYR